MYSCSQSNSILNMIKRMQLSLSVYLLCLCIAFSAASFLHSGLQQENTEVFMDDHEANHASSSAATVPREKRGFIKNQQPSISSVSSVVLACKQGCVNAFMASIYPIKHYFNLASPFPIFRRIWDAYDKLGKCQHECLGINECEIGADNCAADSTCTDTLGNFECTCNPGFLGDGIVACININECDAGVVSCAPDATCMDTPGSFECVCNAGFEGDGTTMCTFVLGTTADNPAVSCGAILSANPAAQSGMYFLRSANSDPSDPSTSVFCDMTLDCDGVVGGWRQIADINPEIECPEGSTQISLEPGDVCFTQPGPGCSLSLPFPVNGIEYSQVCGRITGSRSGSFLAFGVNPGATIDDQYVEGISITTNSSASRQRTHIWTFALSNGFSSNGCPCTSAGAPQPPNFVGSDYFCEGGGGLIWDGESCSPGEACSCTEDQGNGPPLFLRSFDSPIAEDVEARFCADSNSDEINFHVLQVYTR